ncbi:MAG: DUF3108 domain-containing protein [Elusimicrobiales bacterium]
MKLLLLLLTPVVSPAFAAEREPLLCPLNNAAVVQTSSGPATPAWFGEKVEYAISWGLITVGHADIWAKDIVSDTGGRPLYHIISTARSTGFMDTFFKVRDINESWITTDDYSSRGYRQIMREGNFLWDEWVLFDAAAKKFSGENKDRGGNIDKPQGDIPVPIQDVLSALFYMRSQKLEVGGEFSIDVNNTKNWPMIVKVTEREKISLPGGNKYDCFVLEPLMREKGIFVQKGKRMRVWVTADQYRTPVMMRAEVFVGNVTAWAENITR